MTGTLTAFSGTGVFDGTHLHDDAALVLRGARVEGVLQRDEVPGSAARIDLGEGVVAPGFVDLQVNGGGGVLFNHAPAPDTLRRIADAHARLGATTILPTLITDRPEATAAAIEATVAAIRDGVPGIAGLHLEGPHLSRARKGAHSAALIRPMEETDVTRLAEAAARLPVLMVTVAPESVTLGQMRRLAEAGVRLSLGHSDCSFEDAEAAARAGVRCVTHLFNAMSQLASRAPGLVGAALMIGELSAGLIADLVHVHPQTIRTSLAAKRGPGRLFLVTDAMATAGSEIDRFQLNGRTILRRDGRLTLEDGTLAGADLDMATAISNMRDIGVPPEQALAMATSIPAEIIGLGDLVGSLLPGRNADFVHLDPAGKLSGVWRMGVRVT